MYIAQITEQALEHILHCYFLNQQVYRVACLMWRKIRLFLTCLNVLAYADDMVL